MKDKALFGLLSGILLVVVTLVGVGLLNPRPAESATAGLTDGSRAACMRAHDQHPGYAVGPECAVHLN